MHKIVEQSTLYKHIQLVRTRPRIFLGGYGVALLSANLYGWKAHRFHVPDNDLWASYFYDNFHLFVAQNYGEKRKVDWHAVIRAQEPDARAQMTLFDTLLTEFCEGYAP
jgi:hypothetical protein